MQDPSYPNSRCQLRRTKVRDYKKLEREGKTVRLTKLLVSPALVSAIALNSKKNKPTPEVNVWSGKDYSSESRGPTIVSPWKPHAKDEDKSKLLGIPLRDIGHYKPKKPIERSQFEHNPYKSKKNNSKTSIRRRF
ncbi:MAG: hypothetical protein QG639_74 [Patescibacteria group bacterium]|nr:hypothetical protein [Patescibacteria group bacterium]